MPLRWWKIQIGMFALLIAAIAVGCAIGPIPITLGDMFSAFIGEPTPNGLIFIELRLPRVLTAASVGAALALAGTAYQAILRNPLAEPFLIGVSGGAALGGAVVIVTGAAYAMGGAALAVAGFAGAAAGTVLIHRFASIRGELSAYHIVLVGVVFNAFSSATIMLMTSLVSSEKSHQVIMWLMGNVQTSGYAQASWMVGAVAVAGAAIWSRTNDLNALCFGDVAASQLGAQTGRTKNIAYFSASLLTGAAVAASGMIGFVGLMVPHALRSIFGADNRVLVPASIAAGGAFLALADAIARAVIQPAEVPVGVITAFVGGPFFIWILRGRSAGVGDG